MVSLKTIYSFFFVVRIRNLPVTVHIFLLSAVIPLISLKVTRSPFWRWCIRFSRQVTTPGLAWIKQKININLALIKNIQENSVKHFILISEILPNYNLNVSEKFDKNLKLLSKAFLLINKSRKKANHIVMIKMHIYSAKCFSKSYTLMNQNIMNRTTTTVSLQLWKSASDVYKQVSWSWILHFDVLNALVMDKKKDLSESNEVQIVMTRILSQWIMEVTWCLYPLALHMTANRY